MGRPTIRRVSALVAVAVLAAVMASVTEPEPPPAAAHNEPSNPQQLCNAPGWVEDSFGSRDCYVLDRWHYLNTSDWQRLTSPGPGATCDPYTGQCFQRTTTGPCDQPSQSARCKSPAGTNWKHRRNNSSGPYAHYNPSKVTFGCGSGKHRHRNTCHRHPLTPAAAVAANYLFPLNCGTWEPHSGLAAPSGPVKGGNPNPPTPAHISVYLGPACGVTPTTTRRPTSTTTTTTTTTVPGTLPEVTVSGQVVDEGDGAADFTITLSSAATSAVTVVVATSDGTATAGSDYASVATRTVTIPASRTTAIVSVTVTDDTADEPDEDFEMRLSSPSSNANLAATAAATATIRDDDEAAPVVATNVMFDCAVSGGVFTLNASWDPPVGGASGYQVQMGSNPVAWHFTGELFFASQTVTTMTATAPAAGTYYAVILPFGVGGSSGVRVQVSTQCDLSPEVYLAGPSAVAEGNALQFEVRLRRASAEDVTVTVSTAADPGATHRADATGARRDYLPKSSHQVVITAGLLSETVRVFTIADTADEPDETLLFGIDSVTSSVGGVVGSPDTAVGTIVDNDNPPEVSIVDASASESGPVTFNVTLSAASRKTVTVTASTAASSPVSAAGTNRCVAVDGSDDYQSGSTLVVFAANTATESVSVAVCDDAAAETDETFAVALTGAVNATISPSGVAVGTIRDNDAAATLPIYVPPPPAPECPTGWHEHGFDCEPDHTVPIVCGTSAHAYQIHDINDPTGHRSLTHPACVAVPDVCSTGFHDHAGTCVRTHEDPPLPCYSNRRLAWQDTIHGTSEVLACPDPAVDAALLVNTAGKSITLSFSVDVTSGHVAPARTFRITAVDGTAVNSTHYTMTTPVTAMFDATTQTYTVSISTIARQDHGTDQRRFTVTIVDTHPLRGHVSVTVTAAINPPAIPRQ